MLNLSLTEILLLLTQYKYLIVFPVAIVEGPIISVLSGFLSSTHIFNIYFVFLVLLAGDFVGDTIYYAIGRYGGRNIISSVGRYLGATQSKVENLEKRFNRHDWKILLFGKTQAIGSVILFVAGIIKMPYGRFIFYNIIGTIPKVIVLMAIGYYFGKAYMKISTYLDYFAIVWFIFSLFLLVIYYYFRKYIREKSFADL